MQGVRKRFGATVALDGVDLQVSGGEVLALVGENGAGKSTLMKVISGAHAPDEGEMWLDGEPYAPRDPLEARRRGVAMIYQELSVAKDLTVMENMLLGMEPTSGPFVRWAEMKRQAAGAMAQLGRPDIDPAAPLSKLSLAERQLVEIGRAICVGCRVLVLDEPTSSLTQSDIRHLFDLVRRLQRFGDGDHLHLPFSRRGSRNLRSLRGSARRKKRWRRDDVPDRYDSDYFHDGRTIRG